MLENLVSWIANTHASSVIRTVTWIIPTVQTIHILAISAVVSSVMLLHLRSFGLAFAGEPRTDVARRFLPIIWYGVLVLLATGLILIVGEPRRELVNPAFQLKMVLLIAALVLILLYQRTLQVSARHSDAGGAPRFTLVVLSLISLVLWIAIVVAGRWIAYADA